VRETERQREIERERWRERERVMVLSYPPGVTVTRAQT
jgi:hypothetical protein